MRSLRAVGGSFAPASPVSGRRQIMRWLGMSAAVAITTVAVLLASLLAVVLGLT
jgi:hypothetical protein